MERVIFRKEYNKYREDWGYIACFPDIEANAGHVAMVPFFFVNDTTWFEPFGEAMIDYLYGCPIVHKNDSIIPKLVEALNIHYGYEDGELKVVEKITRRAKR